MDYQPVVVIGAPRSGTNMLRDALTSLPGLATWPCDEINYIWRHGNVFWPSDEFSPDMARPGVARYVRRQFEWVRRRYKADFVVEKTCANSLRVEFVNKILPEAKFVVLRRNGIDAAASAMKKWNTEADLVYLARKARFVPWMDFPAYVFIYARSALRRAVAENKQLSRWGPVMSDMDRTMSENSLAEVCILQWKRCVDLTDQALAKLDSKNVHEVAYETFVRSPGEELAGITEFINLSVDRSTLNHAVLNVTAENIGNGKKSIKQDVLGRMHDHANGTLKRHGYA